MRTENSFLRQAPVTDCATLGDDRAALHPKADGVAVNFDQIEPYSIATLEIMKAGGQLDCNFLEWQWDE